MNISTSRSLKILTTFALCLFTLSSLPLSLAGGGFILRTESITYVEITHAEYLDLDGDGNLDDVQTDFTVYSPTGQLDYVRMDFDFYLTLPSGKTFWWSYKAVEYFDVLPVTLEWLNVVEESGWYLFRMDAKLSAIDDDGSRINLHITESLEFDPPANKDGGIATGIIHY